MEIRAGGVNLNDNTCENLTAFTRIFFKRYIETTNTKPFGKYKAVYFPSITAKKSETLVNYCLLFYIR